MNSDGLSQLSSLIYNDFKNVNNTISEVYNKANLAYESVSAAYDKANNAYDSVSAAYNQANAAYNKANSAYNAAGSAYYQASHAYTQANSAYRQANAAYAKANNAAFSLMSYDFSKKTNSWGCISTTLDSSSDLIIGAISSFIVKPFKDGIYWGLGFEAVDGKSLPNFYVDGTLYYINRYKYK